MSQTTVERDTENREHTRRPGRVINRSPALARYRETIQQSRRSSIADWTTSMDAPREQLDAFDGAIGGLHDAVAVGNHSVWGDPLPARLAAVQLTPNPSATSAPATSAPNRSTPEGGTASDHASYAAPPTPRARACPEVNANFERAVAHANLRNLLDDLFRLPAGGTGDQVALRDERGQTQIVSRAQALASRRRVESELRQRIAHFEGDIARLRQMLRSLRFNNQDATNPFDFPSAERQVATLERRLGELRSLLAGQSGESWSHLSSMIDAASESADTVLRFIRDHIAEDTTGAELARSALRSVRNTSLAVFTAAAITASGGMAGVALAGAAGATFEAAEQVSEIGNQQRQRVSGSEIGAAALYAMVNAAVQILMGGAEASGLALGIMQRAEAHLLSEGVPASLARSGARRVAAMALEQISSRLTAGVDEGVRLATGASRDRREDHDVRGTATGTEQLIRQPGTALQSSLPSWTPAAAISALDRYGLDRQLESAAEGFVQRQTKRTSDNDQARMESLGADAAVIRANVVRSISSPIQMRRQHDREADVHTTAAAGLRGTPTSLPYASQIQKAFGRHDVSSVSAHLDGAAKKANTDMGALAYASGNAIAFGQSPDLHTAAHEAAHIVQQRAGLSLSGGVGQTGDTHERHADEVAQRVVSGRSAEDLLDAYTSGQGGDADPAPVQRSVQRRAAWMPLLQFDGIGDHLRQLRDGLRHPLDTVRGHRQWERNNRDRQAAQGAMDSEPAETPTWFTDLKGAVTTARDCALSFASGVRSLANDPATATSDALNSEAHHLAVVERVLDHPTIRAGLRAHSVIGNISLIARLAHLHDSARDAQARYMADPTDQNQRAFAVAMTSYINAVGEVADMVPGIGDLAGNAINALKTVDFLALSRRVTSMGSAADPYRRGGSQSAEMGDTPLPD